jgi:hypothetical protein
MYLGPRGVKQSIGIASTYRKGLHCPISRCPARPLLSLRLGNLPDQAGRHLTRVSSPPLHKVDIPVTMKVAGMEIRPRSRTASACRAARRTARWRPGRAARNRGRARHKFSPARAPDNAAGGRYFARSCPPPFCRSAAVSVSVGQAFLGADMRATPLLAGDDRGGGSTENPGSSADSCSNCRKAATPSARGAPRCGTPVPAPFA